jgi:hypothetical protein
LGGVLFSVIVYAWLDLQETSYGFDYGSLRSLAGLFHACGGGNLSSSSAAGLRLAAWELISSSSSSREGDLVPTLGEA